MELAAMVLVVVGLQPLAYLVIELGVLLAQMRAEALDHQVVVHVRASAASGTPEDSRHRLLSQCMRLRLCSSPPARAGPGPWRSSPALPGRRARHGRTWSSASLPCCQWLESRLPRAPARPLPCGWPWSSPRRRTLRRLQRERSGWCPSRGRTLPTCRPARYRRRRLCAAGSTLSPHRPWRSAGPRPRARQQAIARCQRRRCDGLPTRRPCRLHCGDLQRRCGPVRRVKPPGCSRCLRCRAVPCFRLCVSFAFNLRVVATALLAGILAATRVVGDLLVEEAVLAIRVVHHLHRLAHANGGIVHEAIVARGIVGSIDARACPLPTLAC